MRTADQLHAAMANLQALVLPATVGLILLGTILVLAWLAARGRI